MEHGEGKEGEGGSAVDRKRVSKSTEARTRITHKSDCMNELAAIALAATVR